MPSVRQVIRAFTDGIVSLVGTLFGWILAVAVRRGWLYFPFLSDLLAHIPFSVGWKLRAAVYCQILPGWASAASCIPA